MWFQTNHLGEGGSAGTEGFRVPPTRLSVTEPARGRMGPLQGHTAGSDNTYSAGQTVSQNNFIVPKIGVESKAETWEVSGAVGGGDAKRERGSVGNWGTGKRGVPGSDGVS